MTGARDAAPPDPIPARVAALHAAAFDAPGWSAREIAALAAAPGGLLLLPDGAGADPGGFALGRVAGPEAELLMLAVHPARRRAGLGRALLAAFITRARARGAVEAFLEVAENNAPARALYAAAGFAVVGRRRGYYLRPGAPAADALVMRRGIGGVRPTAPAP